jgi:hypothetical protein
MEGQACSHETGRDPWVVWGAAQPPSTHGGMTIEHGLIQKRPRWIRPRPLVHISNLVVAADARWMRCISRDPPKDPRSDE